MFGTQAPCAASVMKGMTHYERNPRMHRRFMVVLMVLLFPALVYGGTTGKVTGMVKDKEAGTPLPGANVVLVGAPVMLGATSDADGRFILLNVPAGTYGLKCSFIGFQEVVVRNVQITPDLTTKVDFTLTSQTLELGQTLEVVATRPLIQRDQTASARLITSDEIENLPVRGYAGVTALQAGVTDMDGNLYVRGGRLEEVAYYVDGVSQQDLQTGTTRTSINNNAIDQVVVTVGGFEAEYGRVMSGIVNVVTKEGGRKYTGSAEYITDEITGRSWLGAPSFGYNNLDASLGGPLLPGNDRLSFFVSGERRDRKDRRPRWGVKAGEAFGAELGAFEQTVLSEEEINMLRDGVLPHYSLEGWSWQSKLTFRISDNLLFKAGFLGSTDSYESYSHAYRYDLQHAPRVERFNNSAFAKLTYTVNPRTFFTIGMNTFVTRFKGGDGVHFDNIYDYGRPNGNPRYDAESLFVSWDVDSTTTVRDDKGFFTGDEGHVYDDYEQTSSFYITPIDFDITSQVAPNHQLRAGFDVQWHRLRSYHHLFPILSYRGPWVSPDDPGGFQDANRYGYNFDYYKQEIVPLNSERDNKKNPILAAFYAQDKIEYEGLVINLGLRYDYLNARTKVLKDATQPLGGDSTLDPADLSGNSVYHKLSPRAGVGFPVTDKTMFHVNYGIFYQQPRLEDLYVGLDYLEYKAPLGGYFYNFGNPNLKPEETTAYEVGVIQQFSSNVKVDVTAYYKAVKNLVEATTIPSKPSAFSSFQNRDYGTIKGVDMSVVMRRKNRLAARLSYSLSYATGTGSNPTSQRNIAWTFQPGFTEPPKTTSPLAFDQRHKISASLDYRFVENDGPRFMGGFPLANVGVNVLISAGSGMPYTPTYTYNEVTLAAAQSRPSGPVNSSYGPWSFQVDMKVNKRFQVGRIQGNVYVWAINLLNRANSSARDTDFRGTESAVYNSTGDLFTTGWLNTPEGREFVKRYGELGRQKYTLAEQDPRNFSTPRQIRFGMSYEF